jgi:predicted aspartyl protease
MRKALSLFCCAMAFAAAESGQLRQLTDKFRFFELRRALEQQSTEDPEVLFYRGQVACRFGHESEGIDLLRKAVAGNLDSGLTRKAHEQIAEACERAGRYSDAAQAWAAALALTPKKDPDRDGNENTRSLMASLNSTPPTTVEFADEGPVQAKPNKLGSLDVPLNVSGMEALWIFDTGANISTLCESEARRLGLTVRDSKAFVSGSTGKRNPLRLAIAPVIQFGSARVHDVVFLVLSDSSLKIGPLNYQITGILGLPVLRAIGRLEVTKSGLVRERPPATPSAGAPNLYFDGSSPIVEVDHNGHHLQMLLDTGANTSALYPSVREALTPGERSGLRRKLERTAGAGGAVSLRTSVIPLFGLDILAHTVEIKDVSLLHETPSGNRRFRDGVIGMDALTGGFVLDFDAMRLEAR